MQEQLKKKITLPVQREFWPLRKPLDSLRTNHLSRTIWPRADFKSSANQEKKLTKINPVTNRTNN